MRSLDLVGLDDFGRAGEMKRLLIVLNVRPASAEFAL
jgi:hypothetical protein